MSDKKEDKKQQLDATQLAEILMKAEQVDRKSFYLHSFLRGLLAGAGTVIGATVLIALLLWILSFFDTVPLIGPTVDNVRHSIQEHNK